MPFVLRITNSCFPYSTNEYPTSAPGATRYSLPPPHRSGTLSSYIPYMHLFDSTITECALDSPRADNAHPRRSPNFPQASERALEDVSERPQVFGWAPTGRTLFLPHAFHGIEWPRRASTHAPRHGRIASPLKVE